MLPTHIGPAEFGDFRGPYVAVPCPSDLEPLIRHAGLSLDEPA
jgi:hypothetical protein